MIDLQTLTSLGPIPLLVAACNALGLALKKSPINDRWIPLILLVTGATVYPFLTTEADANVCDPFLFNVLLGGLIGGSAVGVNQIFRQLVGGQPKETTNNEKTDPTPPAAG